MVVGVLTLAMKLFGGVDMTGNPLLLLSCVAGFASLQFFSMGILGEVAARNYYRAGRQKNYVVKQRINLDVSDLAIKIAQRKSTALKSAMLKSAA